jgi:uncharacterized protein (DUF305 family)
MKMMIATMALMIGIAPAMAQGSGLPDICISPPAGHEMSGAMDMPMDELDDAHRALMAGMDKMHADMDEGMKAADIDVAFICGMLPHHQGAIDMAKAELQYGDDPWARELAQKIIDAQEAEIAQMKEWLTKVAP